MSTKDYRVNDGVETVDGRPVPESRIVSLTDAAARFDLDAGKITPLEVRGDESANGPRTKDRPLAFKQSVTDPPEAVAENK